MEGFGLPALEAMTHHAPVASSNASCLPEVYGEAAHYFDPLDTDDMAQAINDILTNPPATATDRKRRQTGAPLFVGKKQPRKLSLSTKKTLRSYQKSTSFAEQ